MGPRRAKMILKKNKIGLLTLFLFQNLLQFPRQYGSNIKLNISINEKEFKVHK